MVGFRFTSVLTLVCALLVLTPASSWAVLTVTVESQLDFATAISPSSGTDKIVLLIDGTLNVSATNAMMLDTATAQGRVFAKSNKNNVDVNIDIQNIQVPEGMILDNFNVRYRNKTYNMRQSELPTGWIKGPGKAGQDIQIVARLRFNKNTPPGIYNLNYDLVIDEAE